MTLQTSPSQISLLNIQSEFGGASPAGLNEYYPGGSYVPLGAVGYPDGIFSSIASSGAISFSMFHGATNVIPAGFFPGGQTVDNVYLNSVDKFNLGPETFTTLSSTFSTLNSYATSSNALDRCYWYQSEGLNVSFPYIWKIPAATDTIILLAAQIPGGTTNQVLDGRRSVTSSVSSYTFAYSDSISNTTLSKFNLATETSSVGANTLSTNGGYGAGVYSSTKGYIVSGVLSYDAKAGLSYTGLVQSITFSTDTTGVLSGSNVTQDAPVGAFSTSTNGYITFYLAAWVRFNFSTETPNAGAPYDTTYASYANNTAQLTKSPSYGYFITSNGQATNNYSNLMQRYVISSDTYGSVLAATFPTTRRNAPAGTSGCY